YRRDIALPFGGTADRRLERGAVALDDDVEDRAVIGPEHLREGAHKARIFPRDTSTFVDGGDRHRRVVKETHEAHFGGALRVGGAVLARTVEHQRARNPGLAV